VKEFCPQCGSARAGAFRYCLGCRLDYDSLETDSSGFPAITPRAELVRPGPVAARRTSARHLPLRGLLAAGLAVLIGLTGSVTGITSTSPESAVATPASTPAAVAAAIPSPKLAVPVTEDLTSGPTGQTTEARVVGVVDGDTIVVAFAQKEYEVRYIGMGSSATTDSSGPVLGAGPQALAANKALVDGKTVILEKDVSEADQDGRLLRYVWLTDGASWTLVNLELIKKGLVSVATNMPDVKYVGLYLAAERNAQATAVGLWRADPTLKPAAKPKPKPNPQPKPKPTPKPKSTKCHPSHDPCPPVGGDTTGANVGPTDDAPVKVIGPSDHRGDRNRNATGHE